MDLSTTLQIQSKRAVPSRSSRLHSKCLILSLSLLALPFLFYLLSTARKLHLSPKFAHSLFGIVNHPPRPRRLPDPRLPLPRRKRRPSSSMLARPALSSFAANTDAAGASLAPLLPLRHNAGAQERASHCEAALVLRSSGFWFKDDWARVISGEEQGVYCLVELGGASLQVTFAHNETLEVQSSPSRIIKLFGVTYHLYSQGLPQFGQDAAWESLYENSRELTPFSNSTEGSLVHPCVPRGYKLMVNASDEQFLVSPRWETFLNASLKLWHY
ncbi:hypothetical protein M0R45_016030 [Rubus argutus]|uniref:Uncharacterized protein n=1 Tax=Rubus argutus TaxID=59490 RepID=A0AAW1XV14_RUBAR